MPKGIERTEPLRGKEVDIFLKELHRALTKAEKEYREKVKKVNKFFTRDSAFINEETGIKDLLRSLEDIKKGRVHTWKDLGGKNGKNNKKG